MLGMPDSTAAAVIDRASSREAPSGFSQKTGLAAAIAVSAICRCVVWGDAITIAPTRGLPTSSSQRWVDERKPNSVALRAAPSAVVLQITSHTGRKGVLNTAPTDL